MDNNEIARRMTEFGQRKAKIAAAITRRAAQLEQVIEEECAFHQSLIPAANLSPEVEAQSVAPKDR